MIVDIAVGVILLISIIIAFWRGFIREILTIFGIVGGLVASYIGGPLLIPYVHKWLGIVEGEDPEKLFNIVPYPLLADVSSYASILIIVVIILSVISHFLAESVKNLGLGALDRTLGIVFGIVRGVLVLGLFYLPVYYLMGDEQKETLFADSKTHIYLEMTSASIAAFIPEDTAEDTIKKVEEKAEEMDVISETRKKLEEMDVLGSGETKNATDNQKDGYTPEFRETMDQLFEKSTTPQTEENLNE